MLTSLAQIQTLASPATAWPANMPGTLMLGAVNMADGQSCVGDVAWLHGFRDYFTTTKMLEKEIKQTWISRWPRAAELPVVQASSDNPCSMGATQGTFIRHPNGFIGWNPTGTRVMNPVDSCQTGICPGQSQTACGSYKQLTPGEFGTYTQCPNHFNCSMMANPSVATGGNTNTMSAQEAIRKAQEMMGQQFRFPF